MGYPSDDGERAAKLIRFNDTEDDYVVRGRFCHLEPADKPVHHVKVRLFVEAQTQSLGECYTGMDGSFLIRYRRPPVWPADLYLRLYLPAITYDGDKLIITEEPIVNAHRGICAREVWDSDSDCGVFNVPVWERQPIEKSFTPRLRIGGDLLLQQQQVPGRENFRIYMMAKSSMMFSKLMCAVWDTPVKNKTMLLRDDPERQALPESDEYLVEMLLNGFNPCLLMKADNEPRYTKIGGDVFVRYSYRGVGTDGKHDPSDTTAILKFVDVKTCEGTTTKGLKLIAMDICSRVGELQSSPNATYGEPTLYFPPRVKNSREGQLWERVKRMWRCNYFLFGEALAHLCETHLNIEQYVLAVMRNLRRNPIHRLLVPHMLGTVAINLKANEVLVSPDGLVVANSPVTPTSVMDVVRGRFKQLNWYGWKPRKPILDDQHIFARKQELYWSGVLEPFVEQFMEDNREEIDEFWPEIEAMNADMVANALELDDSHTKQPYWDFNEVNTSDEAHRRQNGRNQTAAVSPILNHDDLKQFCKYIIMVATMRHSHHNDSQFDLGGDPNFTSLGLQKDLTDLSVGMDEVVSNHEKDSVMFMTYALSHVDYGYIVANEERDMHPHLRGLLAKNKEAFQTLGQNVAAIRSTINI
eukprot:Rhum_TRINITY_DN21143_c0_g1::Rhum_TRINITY_DN21143_c0_g1_i1::g.173312::m.173312